MVDVQRVARSIFIAETTAVPIQGKASGTFCGPCRRGDVRFVHHWCPGFGGFSKRAGWVVPFIRATWHSIAVRISCVTERRWRAATSLICSQRGPGIMMWNRCLSIAQV